MSKHSCIIICNGYNTRILLDSCTIGGDLIFNLFCSQLKLKLEEVAAKMLFATAIKRSRLTINYKIYITIKLAGYKFSTYLYICHLKDCNIILEDPTLIRIRAVIVVENNHITIQPDSMNIRISIPMETFIKKTKILTAVNYVTQTVNLDYSTLNTF